LSRSSNVSVYDCALNIGSDLKEWAQTKSFGFSFSRDPLRTFELLANAPNGGTVVLSFDSSSGEGDNIRRQNRRMNYVANLVVNNPLDVSPESDYSRAPDETATILEILAELETRIMSFVPPSLAEGRESIMDRVQYGGTTGLTMPNGQPLRGYAISFSFLVETPPVTIRDQ